MKKLFNIEKKTIRIKQIKKVHHLAHLIKNINKKKYIKI
jgi:hypothetical protein